MAESLAERLEKARRVLVEKNQAQGIDSVDLVRGGGSLASYFVRKTESEMQKHLRTGRPAPRWVLENFDDATKALQQLETLGRAGGDSLLPLLRANTAFKNLIQRGISEKKEALRRSPGMSERDIREERRDLQEREHRLMGNLSNVHDRILESFLARQRVQSEHKRLDVKSAPKKQAVGFVDLATLKSREEALEKKLETAKWDRVRKMGILAKARKK